MGGLVARAYIQGYSLRWVKLLETERVPYRGELDKLIMIATPNHGSIWGLINYAAEIEPDVKSLFEKPKFSSVQMIPGSAFLDKLNDTSLLRILPKDIDYRVIHGTKFISIEGEPNDGIVLHSSSQLSEWEAISGYNIRNYDVSAAHVQISGFWEPGIAYINSESHPTWEVIRNILETFGYTASDHVETVAPVIPGAAYPSQDLDKDGLSEDVNGNSRQDFDDVVTLFNAMDSPEVQENTDYFDFNGNGRIDFDDIVRLMNTVSGE
jgi:PKD repeat protein